MKKKNKNKSPNITPRKDSVTGLSIEFADGNIYKATGFSKYPIPNTQTKHQPLSTLG